MDRFSEKEKGAWRNFWRSELGEKGLEMIKELRDEQIDKAMAAVDGGKSAEVTHDYLVKATAIDTIYYMLKPTKGGRVSDE